MKHIHITTIVFLFLLLIVKNSVFSIHAVVAQESWPLRHGINVHGELLHKKNFKHYNYVNPNAPKGGKITFLHTSVFNSLNPFSINGSIAPEIRFWLFESLLSRSYDEPFSMYGLIAQKLQLDPSGMSIIFHLNKKARFSDNHPITAKDVYFSYKLLKEKGLMSQRRYFAKIKEAKIHDTHTIQFIFHNNDDKELPLIIALMPILPQHIYEKRDITKSSMDIPIGSGPYVVGKFNGSQYIEYKRNKNHWARDLNVTKGRFNFDTVRFNVITDNTVSIEALIAGQYDMRFVTSTSEWFRQYNVASVKEGRLKKREFTSGLPAGMKAFVMNARKDVFRDIRVRKAFNYVFNFEMLNRQLFFEGYTRTQGYFDNSYFSSVGKKANAKERELLKPFRNELQDDIVEGQFILPIIKNSRDSRFYMKKAIKLFKEAGYEIRNKRMVHVKTQKPVIVTMILLERYKEQKRVALNFQKHLGRIGVQLNVEIVDSTLYQNRLNNYDYDLMYYFWFASLSPGNEQNFYWGGKGYTQEGTRNYMGAQSKAVDAMVHSLLQSKTKDDYSASVRALDRVLRSQFYVVPLYHLDKQLVIIASHIATPKHNSLYGMRPDSWWSANTLQ